MPVTDIHRVRRLRWQARAAAPDQAFALRSLLRERQDEVHNLLDRVLGGVAPQGVVLKLPRLALQLQARDLADLDGALLPRLEAALREALATTLRSEVSGLDDDPPPSSAAIPPLQRVSGPAHARDALRRYLAHGDLPWALAGLAPEAAQHTLEEAASVALNAVLAGTLRMQALLPDNPAQRVAALGRWLALLPPAGRRRWLQATAAPNGPDAPWLMRWWAWVDDDSPQRFDAQALWLAWRTLDQAVPGPATARAWRQVLDTRLRAADAAGAWPAALAKDLVEWLDTCIEAHAPPDMSAPAASAAVAPNDATGARAINDTAKADEASRLVPLAGLVLLHPYLPRLLRGCGIVEDGERHIDEAQLPRACALLHALACGDAPASEFSLPLVKLLLGRRPDEPLPLALPALAEADRDELNALLDAVRQHWTALRGTGAEGLRVSFLQRRGLLRQRDGAWLLQMQTEAFDMLIALLPWSLGFVKLPWMPSRWWWSGPHHDAHRRTPPRWSRNWSGLRA